MAPKFRVEIVTPYRTFFEGDVEMIILRVPTGEMGVMKGHIPMVVAVTIGPIRILQEGQWKYAVLTGGFMKIERDRTVIVTDTAEWPEEIDVNRALAAKARAEERLRRKMSRMEMVRSQTALARALARLKVTKEIK